MRWKTLVLTVLCIGTITACAHTPVQSVSGRGLLRQQQLESNANISSGACDAVGQLMPADNAAFTLEASAAPVKP